jgi:periplasmic protein TonB
MPASAEIWEKNEDWQQPLAWSVALHAFLFGGILMYAAILGSMHGENWGGTGGGGAIGVELVSNIPIPRAPADTENILANPSKGLTKTEPAKPEVVPPDAIPIPDKTTRTRPTPRPRDTQQVAKAAPPPPPTNVVPFGQGGPISAGMFGTFNAAGAKGGFGFTGGGGDFGSRFSWYVAQVRNKVSENWLKYEVDPNIHEGKRVYITFDITRSGQPTNIQIEQSSGVPSLDQSAVRTLQRIDTFGPLPNEYSGSRVSVEFWFDYRR